MLKNSFFLIFIVIILSSCTKEPTCQDFRIGNFKYTNKDVPYKIVRNDTLQIESHPSSGIEIHNKVVWTSDCNYELTCTDVVNGNANTNQLVGHTIFVEITEVTENSYKSKVKSDFMDKEIELIKE